MPTEDILVGAVAVLIGLALIAISAFNASWYFGTWKTRWLDQRLGRPLTRLTLAGLGILIILLGIAIVRGYGPNASTASSCRPLPVALVAST